MNIEDLQFDTYEDNMLISASIESHPAAYLINGVSSNLIK